MIYLSVKLRAGVVLDNNNNFEKYIMKIHPPNTQWKDREGSIKSIARMQQWDISSQCFQRETKISWSL